MLNPTTAPQGVDSDLSSPYGDHYQGTPLALIAAGIITEAQVPGTPGMPKCGASFVDGVLQPKTARPVHDERWMQVVVYGTKKLRVTKGSYNKQRDAAFGANEALRKYAEDASNSGAQIESALTGAFKSAEDALVSFVTTGKGSFKTFADAVIAQLARIAIQQSITGPFSSWLAGLLGGGSSTTGASFGSGAIAIGGSLYGGPKAAGGPVSSGTTYLVGEKGPELFVPGASGAIVPNGALANGGGGGDTYHYNFTVGDVATVSMVREAVSSSERRTQNGFRRSRNYAGEAA